MKKEIIPNTAYIIPLEPLRHTPCVDFESIPELPGGLSAITQVRHCKGACSPSIEGCTDNLWYMHTDQADNLLVIEGERIVHLYNPQEKKKHILKISSTEVRLDEKVIHNGPAIVGWPEKIFHQVHSPRGSMSMNFAQRKKQFDIKTNFNIYVLNEETAQYQVAREGHLDQPK